MKNGKTKKEKYFQSGNGDVCKITLRTLLFGFLKKFECNELCLGQRSKVHVCISGHVVWLSISCWGINWLNFKRVFLEVFILSVEINKEERRELDISHRAWVTHFDCAMNLITWKSLSDLWKMGSESVSVNIY